jgi:hypothetical protein
VTGFRSALGCVTRRRETKQSLNVYSKERRDIWDAGMARIVIDLMWMIHRLLLCSAQRQPPNRFVASAAQLSLPSPTATASE